MRGILHNMAIFGVGVALFFLLGIASALDPRALDDEFDN